MQNVTHIPRVFFLFYELQDYMMTERYIFENGNWMRQVNVDGLPYKLEDDKVDFITALAAWNWAKQNEVEMVY